MNLVHGQKYQFFQLQTGDKLIFPEQYNQAIQTGLYSEYYTKDTKFTGHVCMSSGEDIERLGQEISVLPDTTVVFLNIQSA